MANKLSPLLDYNLRIVFIGTEPGPESIEHYYSNKTNMFYCNLFESEWTPRLFTPEEDKLLLNEGIGLDDVYYDRDSLIKRLEKYKPKSVCFNSKEALQRYSGEDVSSPWIGSNASRFIQFSWNPVIWALTDCSYNARRHWHVRIKYLKKLLQTI